MALTPEQSGNSNALMFLAVGLVGGVIGVILVVGLFVAYRMRYRIQITEDGILSEIGGPAKYRAEPVKQDEVNVNLFQKKDGYNTFQEVSETHDIATSSKPENNKTPERKDELEHEQEPELDQELEQEQEFLPSHGHESNSESNEELEPQSETEPDPEPCCSSNTFATDLTRAFAKFEERKPVSSNPRKSLSDDGMQESVFGPPSVMTSSLHESDPQARLDDYDLEDFCPDWNVPRSSHVYGSLRVAISYFFDQNELIITVIEGTNIPSELSSGTLSVSLVPCRPGSALSRSWKEIQFVDKIFKMTISTDEIMTARLRLWLDPGGSMQESAHSTDPLDVDGIETYLDLSEIDEEIVGPVLYTLDMSPIKQVVSTLCDSAILLSPRPEEPNANVPALLVGLMYIRSAGKLVVSVLKARGLTVFCETPDTFVKVTLISPYGDEIGKYKTKLIKQRASPLFDESFVFQVPDQELDFVSMTLSVYCILGVWRRRVLIGWVNVGSKVGHKEREAHWVDMAEASDDTIARWHTLTEP